MQGSANGGALRSNREYQRVNFSRLGVNCLRENLGSLAGRAYAVRVCRRHCRRRHCLPRLGKNLETTFGAAADALLNVMVEEVDSIEIQEERRIQLEGYAALRVSTEPDLF
jgi:hypothetical protein